uniref:SPRY-associated domain-containing protein n=1 Tax=Periophthalmus magnuspinnatus TaxID=409849 RepID=A0A3B4AQU1_9GOBI
MFCVSDSCEFSLDPNTAHRRLLLSEDNQTVTCVKEEEEYPDHDDRFTDYCLQVLSCTGLRGRCYWEVDWNWRVSIAVSFRGIRRSGRQSGFGYNDLSWSLGRVLWQSGLGVFLDSEAGALSFYDVSSDGELFHLWTFSWSFSEPVFSGFRPVEEGSSVTLVKETMN